MTGTSILRSALKWALRGLVAAAGLAFLAIGIAPHFGLYETTTVLSGSMRPTFGPGDLLVLRPEPLSDVRVGQVVTYAIPVGDHHIESHRVVWIRRGYGTTSIRTRGDANNAEDPWTAVLRGKTAWREVAVVPYVGRAILWLREPYPHLASVLMAPFMLILVGLFRIWSRHDHDEHAPA